MKIIFYILFIHFVSSRFINHLNLNPTTQPSLNPTSNSNNIDSFAQISQQRFQALQNLQTSHLLQKLQKLHQRRFQFNQRPQQGAQPNLPVIQGIQASVPGGIQSGNQQGNQQSNQSGNQLGNQQTPQTIPGIQQGNQSQVFQGPQGFPAFQGSQGFQPIQGFPNQSPQPQTQVNQGQQFGIFGLQNNSNLTNQTTNNAKLFRFTLSKCIKDNKIISNTENCPNTVANVVQLDEFELNDLIKLIDQFKANSKQAQKRKNQTKKNQTTVNKAQNTKNEAAKVQKK